MVKEEKKTRKPSDSNEGSSSAGNGKSTGKAELDKSTRKVVSLSIFKIREVGLTFEVLPFDLEERLKSTLKKIKDNNPNLEPLLNTNPWVNDLLAHRIYPMLNNQGELLITCEKVEPPSLSAEDARRRSGKHTKAEERKARDVAGKEDSQSGLEPS